MATTTKKLNPKQERFCQLYAGDREFFGNGTQSYIEAYKPKKKGNWYQTARACAYELLTKPHILDRINEIFEARGLNDAFVDKQLEKLITQDADFKSKVQAIKEYNALKGRIIKKFKDETPLRDLSDDEKTDIAQRMAAWSKKDQSNAQ